jgi:uncharacterized protein (TIGR04222 family)
VSREYERKIAQSVEVAEAQTAEARAAEHSVAEQLRRRDLAIEGRARDWARRSVSFAFWLVVALVVAGEIAIVATISFPSGWLGLLVVLAVSVVTIIGAWGAFRSISELRMRLETRLRVRIRDWLRHDADTDPMNHADDALVAPSQTDLAP